MVTMMVGGDSQGQRHARTYERKVALADRLSCSRIAYVRTCARARVSWLIAYVRTCARLHVRLVGTGRPRHGRASRLRAGRRAARPARGSARSSTVGRWTEGTQESGSG